jgi:hypothetical protein
MEQLISWCQRTHGLPTRDKLVLKIWEKGHSKEACLKKGMPNSVQGTVR